MLRRALGGAAQTVLTLIVMLSCAPRSQGASDAGRFVVVYTAGVQAYAEAVEGIQKGLGDAAATTIDLNSADHDSALQRIRNRPNIVIIAVGADALQALSLVKPASPVVSTMTLHENETLQAAAGSSAFRPTASVHLNLSILALLTELGSVFPGKNRLGVIRNPTRAWEFEPAAAGKANQQGFTVRIVECSQPDALLPSLLSLKGTVDFVLVLPDSSLYNSTTVRPLVLTSLENRLPIVGFSASFVRGGAAMGIYPDFRDIGLQTAELAQDLFAKRTNHAADEGPRKWIIALNQRALRLLGLEHHAPSNAELVLFR